MSLTHKKKQRARKPKTSEMFVVVTTLVDGRELVRRSFFDTVAYSYADEQKKAFPMAKVRVYDPGDPLP